MELINLLPWILLTYLTSLVPIVLSKKLSPWWQRHGDIGEAIGTSLVAGTSIFTVALPILSQDMNLFAGMSLVFIGIALAWAAHHFFEDNGKELAPKSWFAAFAFALHNFPEGVANTQALVASNGINIFSFSLLSHNLLDGMVMAMGLMALGLKRRQLFYALFFAASGEVLGMFVSSLGLSALSSISLLSVGALLGLSLDSITHWKAKEGMAAMCVLFGVFLIF
ncbi:MAG: hypothetical protein CME71_10185 [Halobacteriovorax sp.]|nr:hypothetical protein [Halobacteriovorax sp.]